MYSILNIREKTDLVEKLWEKLLNSFLQGAKQRLLKNEAGIIHSPHDHFFH